MNYIHLLAKIKLTARSILIVTDNLGLHSQKKLLLMSQLPSALLGGCT